MIITIIAFLTILIVSIFVRDNECSPVNKKGFKNQAGNQRKILVFGSSSVADLCYLIRNLVNVTLFEIDFVDFDLTDYQRKEIKNLETLNINITFVKPQHCQPNSYDLVTGFSVGFRHLSPNLYNSQNKELENLGIDTNFPLFSDKNDILGFIKQIINLFKFFLNVTKIDGHIIVYPAAISFEIFDILQQNSDFKIRDWVPEITYNNNRNSYPPSFANAPLTLHYEPHKAYYNDSFVASELLDTKAGVTHKDALYKLSEVAPEMVSFFGDILVVPTHLSYANSVQKLLHINYKVDYILLNKYLQLPGKTMSAIKNVTPEERISKQNFLHSVKQGMRYSRSCRQINDLLKELDQTWANQAFPNTRLKYYW